MSITISEIFNDLKKLMPDFTDEQVQELLNSIQTYCDIIIDYYNENDGLKTENTNI